jgi:phospholipid/cholesterol/gamma-HCH transport system substrate-binding protein
MPSVRQIRWAKFRTMVVCVAAAAILFTLVYLLAGGTLFEAKATLYLYIPDATGLLRNSPVQVDGVSVGKVAGVSLSGSNQPDRIVRVVMKVERDMLDSIPEDSSAQISSETMVGDRFVDITSGRSVRPVRSGGEIRLKSTQVSVRALDLQQFAAQLRAIDAVIADIEQGRSPLGEFVLGEQMYDDVRNRVSQIESGLRAAVQSTSDVGALLYTDAAYRRILDALADLNRGIDGISRSSFLTDAAQYDALHSQLLDLRRNVADFRAQPLVRSAEQYDEWIRGISKLIGVVDDVNASPLLATPQLYDNLDGAAREIRDALKEFHRDPKKYLRMKLF